MSDAESHIDPEYGEIPQWALQRSEPMTHSLPAGLDELAPGPYLAAILSAVDSGKLSGSDRITFLRAQQRMASHYSAGVYDTMAAVAEHMRVDEDDYTRAAEAAAAEIRVALRLTRRATDNELGFALELRERLPAVWDALAKGDIDVRRAKTFSYHTIHLSIAAARTVVGEVIEMAPRLTTGQLAARLKKLCIEANPEEARERYEHAVDQRRVVLAPTVDGTANLCGFALSPDQAGRAMRRINHMARSLRGKGETRTMDQLRSDVFLDLLSGDASGSRSGSGSKGVVDIKADLETLARLNDDPGDLGGYGPVIADIARRVADQSHDAEWRFTVTDPVTGQPFATGVTPRRPTTSQRRHVETRDPSCVFPGCRMPSTECDVDHTIAHADGGPTTVSNCAPLCRHDHGCKHKHGWTYRRLPNGDYRWTTKLGLKYTTSGLPP